MEGLKPGRIVYFVFDPESADQVNRRRTTGAAIRDRMATSVQSQGPGGAVFAWPAGAQAHIGNVVMAAEVCPAMVLRVIDGGTCNLRVFLDGNDDFWATSVEFDAGHEARDHRLGTWHWMFEGQQTRYQPDRTEATAKA